MDEHELQNNTPKIALFLFGGGYRAMLFHLGALWRLNDFGLLRKLTRISSVSGGSIVAGRLAAKWDSLGFDGNGVATKFEKEIASVLRELVPTSVVSSWPISGTRFRDFIPPRVPSRYEELTDRFSLANLPKQPEFIFKATNLQTGAVWRFSRKHTGDGYVGGITEPSLPLATVIAASACLPPRLPVVLEPDSIGEWNAPPAPQFEDPKFRNRIALCDGSFSWDDDLFSQSSDDILLVSDAGALYNCEPRPGLHWLSSKFNALNFSDIQIYERRKREWSGKNNLRGAYWDIAKDIEAYGARDTLKCPTERTKPLSEVRTAFAGIDAARRADVMDWGFASCDAAIRASFVNLRFQRPDASPNGSFYCRPAAAEAAAA